MTKKKSEEYDLTISENKIAKNEQTLFEILS